MPVKLVELNFFLFGLSFSLILDPSTVLIFACYFKKPPLQEMATNNSKCQLVCLIGWDKLLDCERRQLWNFLTDYRTSWPSNVPPSELWPWNIREFETVQSAPVSLECLRWQLNFCLTYIIERVRNGPMVKGWLRDRVRFPAAAFIAIWLWCAIHPSQKYRTSTVCLDTPHAV